MENETRLEELAEAHAADRPDEAESARRQEELPRAAEATDDPGSAAGDFAADAEEWAASEVDRLIEDPGMTVLESGMVIGPLDRRVRLLHDLGDGGRIWLVVAVAPDTEHARGIADEFRAIKLFLPTRQPPGSRESERDERSQRADLIGWRAYLTKVRARVEQAAKLHHPHIAGVYGWRHGPDGWPFAEMEYVDCQRSQSLAQLLREQGQNGLPWDAVLKWLRPVATALDYARQEHRLAHQHLDADAIFLTGQGTVKLLGFGLATEVREPRSVLFGSGDAARETTVEGSPDLVPAETAFRRDVFALALLAYQMLMGQSAYEAKSRVANTMLRPPGLTDEAWRVLRRGLAYPSELCPTDAGELMNALEAAQRSTEDTGRNHFSKRNWASVMGLGLLVALGIYWLAERSAQETGSDRSTRADIRAGARPGSLQGSEESPDGELTVLLQEAEREADLRAFESAKRMDTLVAYQLYLQRCPRCGYRQEARSAMQNLQTEEKINKLKTDFETLARAMERENRDDRGDEALNRLSALALLVPGDPFVAAGRRRIALDWIARTRASINKGDLVGARQGLKKAGSIQPELPELANLAAALQQAEAAERAREADADEFATARRANTRKAYWSYLEHCAATCNYRAEAEATLARLAPTNPVMRDRLSDGSQGPEMVAVPASSFLMGSPPHEKGRYNDEQQHPARIAKPFAIGKYEVMFYEYDRFAVATGKTLPDDQGWGRGRRPVINVSWLDAEAYVAWLSQQTGYRYRLPTETEWEYAARAGTTASRYWGDDPNQGCPYANAADLDGKKVFVGWTAAECHDGHVYTAPAGSYRDNDYGLYDVLGNVLEWTCSLYAQDYRAPAQDCEGPVADRQFVVRGGSWNDGPRNVRSAERLRNQPDFRDYFLGFRVVRELP